MKKTLVVDIGGTAVKLYVESEPERRFASGRWLTPAAMATRVLQHVTDWEYEVVSIGYPGEVQRGQPSHEPWNLGDGWLEFDFAKKFQRPTKLINDASLQALGNYGGGRMLFIGLGTSLGAALIADNTIVSLELGSLAHPQGGTLEERVNSKALRAGRGNWREAVIACLPGLRHSFVADYVTVGGGNARYVRKLPEGCRHCEPNACYVGGCRLWQTEVQASTYFYRSR